MLFRLRRKRGIFEEARHRLAQSDLARATAPRDLDQTIGLEGSAVCKIALLLARNPHIPADQLF